MLFAIVFLHVKILRIASQAAQATVKISPKTPKAVENPHVRYSQTDNDSSYTGKYSDSSDPSSKKSALSGGLIRSNLSLIPPNPQRFGN
jgi:hypothetical protein